ncbi:MAG: hypothetical protein K2W85_12750 [Phycisphaerales bacterium]|nr:hypothetical protein [Phycisphaerales bacterium]
MLGVKFGRRSWCLRSVSLAAMLMPLIAASARAQWTCQTATPITIGVVVNGNNASSPGDGVTGLCTPTNRAAWHSFVPSVTGVHTISTCGSGINAVAALFSDCGLSAVVCDDDTCGDDAVLVSTLNAGQTYYLRVASSGATAGGSYAVLISQPPTGVISGDLCGTGAFLATNSTQTFINGPTTGTDVSACGTGDTSDVFFAFNADAPGTYRVQVCTQAFQPVLSAQAACFSATSLQCDVGTQAAPCAGGGSASLLITPATVPSQVLIRVAGVRGSFGPFEMTLFAPSSNDACANARVLSVGTPVSGRTSPIIGTEGTVACATSAFDVWYTFVPPVLASYTISTCTQPVFDTVLSVHTACPGVPGAGVIACSDNACGSASSVTLSLAAGTPYRVRVAGKGAAPNAEWGPFAILVSQNAPSNDNCFSARTTFEGSIVDSSTIGATGTDQTPGCASNDTKDVWFDFTPTVTSTYAVNTCGSGSSAGVSVFQSCTGAPIACNESDSSFCDSTAGARVSVAMVAGTRYLIRVATPDGGEGSFRLVVVRQPAIGDNCADAMDINGSGSRPFSFLGATPSGVSSCGGDPSAPDVWFSFVGGPERFFRVQTCGSSTPLTLSVFSESPCTGMLTPIACGGSVPSICGTSEGSIARLFTRSRQTYYIRAAATTSLLGAANISIEPDAPINDRCDDAMPLPLGTAVLGSNVDATTDALASCAADGRDVWYQLLPAATGWYRIDTCTATSSSSPLNTVMTLHASCAAPAYACNDDNTTACGSGSNRSALVVRLVAGNPVLLRVAGASGAQGTFSARWQLVPPPNDTCAQAIAVGNGTVELDTLGATDDAPGITGCTITPSLTAMRSDVWFRYTAPQSGTARISVCGSLFDSVLAVSSATGGCPSSAYPILACNDDSICVPGSGVTTAQSAVNLPVTANQAYFIRIGSRDGSGGPGFLQITQGNLCACDFNRSGTLTSVDIIDFLNAWFSQLSSADFNQMGGVTTSDIIDFLNCFFTRPAGC